MSDEHKYMDLALEEARKAEREGNLPIGAILVINREIVGKGKNNQVSNSNYFSHAESMLIGENSSRIKDALKKGEGIELFTTLEPCLMCFGTSVHNRVSRIVYACPDPLAGATSMDPPTEWYRRKWPTITRNVDREASYELFTGYLRGHLDIWENALRQFEDMHKSWQTP